MRWQDIKNDKEKYAAYLCSREWGEKREAVARRAGGRCERCKYRSLDAVHHKTYARKYHEDLDDLEGFCTACHDFTHGRSDYDPALLRSTDAHLGEPHPLGSLPSFDRELLLLVILDPSYASRIEQGIDINCLTTTAREIFLLLTTTDIERGYGSHANAIVALDAMSESYKSADRERWIRDLIETSNRRKDEAKRHETLAAVRRGDISTDDLLAEFCAASKKGGTDGR